MAKPYHKLGDVSVLREFYQKRCIFITYLAIIVEMCIDGIELFWYTNNSPIKQLLLQGVL